MMTKVMRLFFIVTTLMVVQTSFAKLIVLSQLGHTVPADRYLNSIQIPSEKGIQAAIQQQAQKLKNHPIQESPLLYPNNSHFISGRVQKHRLTVMHFSSTPLFVIGPDPYSIRWASENSHYLQQIHAFGMITNVNSMRQTKLIEQQTGLTLVPANLNGLEKIVNTTHYPFLIDQGWVLQ